MKNLKTLYDFEVKPKSWAGAMANAGRKYTIGAVELKQEAIKWIKAFEKPYHHYCVICEEFDCDCMSSDCFKIYHKGDPTPWIKHFFNIKEDQLK